MNRIAYQLPEAARIAGVSRTRIFEAVRRRELTIRKAGRASIVTHDDLVAWIKSLPAKGNVAYSRRDRAAVATTAIAQILEIALAPELRETIEEYLRDELYDAQRQARADCEPE